MLKSSSHYETLKVRHDVSLGVIRSAYKQLARKYHPDRNGNSADSHELMQAVNAAFEVLSDPQRRADYDEWLKRFGTTTAVPFWSSTNIKDWIRGRRRKLSQLADNIRPVREITAARWIARIGFVGLALWALNLDREPQLHADTPRPNGEASADTELAVPTFQRPPGAPNGAPWPVHAAEIAGYPIDRNNGKSVVTVDNSRNYSDVFVKLVSIEGSSVKTVRSIYIPAQSTFRCRNVTKGVYEIRYQDLGSGLAARSGEFEVVETKTNQTMNSSVFKITLARITATRPVGLRISEQVFHELP